MTDNVKFEESRLRSFTKACVHRVLSICGTILITWLLTNDLEKTISITAMLQVFLIALYYITERVWNRIDWGRSITGK